MVEKGYYRTQAPSNELVKEWLDWAVKGDSPLVVRDGEDLLRNNNLDDTKTLFLGCRWEGILDRANYPPLYASPAQMLPPGINVLICASISCITPEEYPHEFPGAQNQPWFKKEIPIDSVDIKHDLMEKAASIINRSDAKVVVKRDGTDPDLYGKKRLHRTPAEKVVTEYIGDGVWTDKGGYFHIATDGYWLRLADLKDGSYDIVIGCSAPRFADPGGSTYNGLAAYRFKVG